MGEATHHGWHVSAADSTQSSPYKTKLYATGKCRRRARKSSFEWDTSRHVCGYIYLLAKASSGSGASGASQLTSQLASHKLHCSSSKLCRTNKWAINSSSKLLLLQSAKGSSGEAENSRTTRSLCWFGWQFLPDVVEHWSHATRTFQGLIKTAPSK